MLRPISKGKQGGTVSYIKEPLPLESTATYNEMLTHLGFQHEYKIIDDGNKVMSTLLLQNKVHLNKAWETLCAHGPLKDYIGDYGLGQGAKDVLDGNFDLNKSENPPAVNF
eukprot:2970804-Ditylum_brightwellii.AAC.1